MPILLSRDLFETLAFLERLGFENRGAAPDEWQYLIVGRGDIELHYVEDPSVDPLRTAAMAYVYVDDAQALYDAWAPLVTPDPETGSRLVEPVDTDCGWRELAVFDPRGNLLRLGSLA